MNKKILRKKLTVFLIMQLLFFVIILSYFWRSRSLFDHIIEIRRRIYELDIKTSQYDQIVKEYEGVGDKGDKLRQRFTYMENTVSLVEEIEKAAVLSGVSLSIETQQQIIDKKTKKEDETKDEIDLIFTLNTESDFNSFIQFLIKLENLNKFNRIDTVDIMTRKMKINEEEIEAEDTYGKIIVGKIIFVAK
jgi:hypothetical protein